MGFDACSQLQFVWGKPAQVEGTDVLKSSVSITILIV